jgi:hypothetical protein
MLGKVGETLRRTQSDYTAQGILSTISMICKSGVFAVVLLIQKYSSKSNVGEAGSK